MVATLDARPAFHHGIHDDGAITEAEVLRRFGWTLAQFRDARLLGFPPAMFRYVGNRAVQVAWRLEAIEGWERSVRSLGISDATRSN